MQTLFDVNDEITFNIRGKIESYSIDRNSGDCYTIEVKLPKNGSTRIYMDTDALRAGNAKLITMEEKENNLS